MTKRYQGGILGVGFNPLQAPDAPTIGAASVGNTQVSVAFTAPADVGGSAISSYRVLANPGGIGATTSSSPATVTGLTNDTTYTFSVAAVNSYGFSPYSGTVSGTPAEPLYIEDVFSTWLYTGNGSAQTITNGIDLSGEGGMVWLKMRSASNFHGLFDTNRGVGQFLASNATDPQANYSGTLTSFGSTGFGIGYDTVNDSGATYASWTFREAPKFFDVVTWTGNGANRTIAHNLGVAPGMIIVKGTGISSNWAVYHRSLGATEAAFLNTTDASSAFTYWNNTAPTSTEFSLGTSGTVNSSGQTYVAYLFAHDATSDGLIQCGSYVGNGSSQTINLGFEPQWVLVKNATTAGWSWSILDNMRGIAAAADPLLRANLSAAEATTTQISLTPTGFAFSGTGNGNFNGSGSTYIYMAIRRGPMRTPTLGTSVFAPVAAVSGAQTTGFPIDLQLERLLGVSSTLVHDRLRGVVTTDANLPSPALYTNATYEEITGNNASKNWGSTGFTVPSVFSGGSGIYWNFRRAPGFFDEVCYTGTSVARTLNHNLGVAPELLIIKPRSSAGSWIVGTTFGATTFTEAVLNSSDAGFFISYDNLINAAPTSTTFSVGSSSGTNGSGTTYVSYLFASCPGVSKVGSYTGNGSSQTIDCSFAAGARFVLIKRTDSTGDWYVWDSARGIVAGNDPYLALNTTAAEVTSNDSVDTDNTGFIVNQVAASNVNVNGATYIFLAIS